MRQRQKRRKTAQFEYLDLRMGKGHLESVARDFVRRSDWWLTKAGAAEPAILQELTHDLKVPGGKSHDIENDPIHLTLPARLMSLLNPRLPIIIFSSTQDRAVLRPFQPFANIITTFTKGTLAHTLAPDYAVRTAAAFVDAVRTAKRMPGAGVAAAAAEAAAPFVAPPATAAGRAGHIELYVDETGAIGKDRLTLGGVVALFRGDNRKGAVDKSHTFNRVCLRKYFSPFEWGSDIGVTGFRGRECNEAFQESLKEGCRPELVSRIALAEATCAPPVQPGKFDLRAGDREHRELLARLIELFVSLVLPALKHYHRLETVSCSVFVATRTLPVGKVSGGYELPYRYGMQVSKPRRGGKQLVYVLRDEATSRLTLDALERLVPIDNHFPQPIQALTIRLAYAAGVEGHEETPVLFAVHHGSRQRKQVSDRNRDQLIAAGFEPDPRALHYIADRVVGGPANNYATVAPWSFDDEHSSVTDAVLQSAQLMNRADGPTRLRDLGRALLCLAGC